MRCQMIFDIIAGITSPNEIDEPISTATSISSDSLDTINVISVLIMFHRDFLL